MRLLRDDPVTRENTYLTATCDQLDKAGAKPTYLNPADMRTTVDQESAMFGDIIKRGNVKL